MQIRRIAAALAVASLIVSLAACSVEYGQTRSSFQIKVAGKTLEEVKSDIGKPDGTLQPAPDTTVLVYKKKTFDSENQNAKDAEVKITFKKEADGTFKFSAIDFTPEL